MIEAQFEETQRHKSGSRRRSVKLKEALLLQEEEPTKNDFCVFVFLYLATDGGELMG